MGRGPAGRRRRVRVRVEDEADDEFEAEAEAEAEPELEPEVEPEPAPAPVRPRRITTRRPAGVRSPAAVAAGPAALRARTEPVPAAPVPETPAPRAPVTRAPVTRGPGGEDPDLVGPAQRVGRHESRPRPRRRPPRPHRPGHGPPGVVPAPADASARAPRIPSGPRPPPAATPPFQPPLDDPPEPLVAYELEDDARELRIDDDDEGWAPPAWVSEAAGQAPAPRPRPHPTVSTIRRARRRGGVS